MCHEDIQGQMRLFHVNGKIIQCCNTNSKAKTISNSS